MKTLQNPTTGIFQRQRVQIIRIKVDSKQEIESKENQIPLESDHTYAAPWESQFRPKLEPLVKLEENNETIDPDLFHNIESSVQALPQQNFEPNEDPLNVTDVIKIKVEPDEKVIEEIPKIIDPTSITKENSRKACPICCKMVHSSSISRHIKAVHKSENKRKKINEEKGKKCRYCMKFFHPSSILRHIKDIHGIGSGHEDKGVPCGSCNLTFPSIEQLNNHWQVNHSTELKNKKFVKHVKNCDIKS